MTGLRERQVFCLFRDTGFNRYGETDAFGALRAS
jgi:hypothetical protein